MKSTVAFLFAMLCGASACRAQEPVRLAIGQGGNLEALVVEIGSRGGLFGKHGLKPEIVYTSGSGETAQATVSGSVEFGVSVGAGGALALGQKGAPIRVIGSTTVGSPIYWYVQKDSPIKSMEDLAGKKLGFSTIGSGSHAVALLVKGKGIDVQLVAAGNPGATFTQVMTGQIDAGPTPPENGLVPLREGRIRVIFRDNDFDRVRRQSLRVLTAHVSVPEPKVQRLLSAYRETVDWIFSGDAAPIKLYAELLGVSEADGRDLVNQFWSREMLTPDKVRGVELAMEDAVAAKLLPATLTQAQLDKLIAPSARP